MAEIIERGKIRNREQAKQLRDFSKLRWGNITPTDIDGYFEMDNQIFVFIEIKYGSREMLRGQALALERLVDVVGQTKDAILIIGMHSYKPETDIDAGSCMVKKYRTGNKWRIPFRKITVREIADIFIKKMKEKNNARRTHA